ncbi:MAG: acyl-CoA dehydrogenase family protein [Pseudomonadota bacterium]
MTTTGANELLGAMLSCPADQPAPRHSDLAGWKTQWRDLTAQWGEPIDRSVFGGFLSDRLAWAFVAGYQGAISRLLPNLPKNAFAAICITEAGGAHPRAIEARLCPDEMTGGWRLSGEKRFITGGEAAAVLVVAASTGVVDGRNQIRMVTVDRSADGIALTPMPPFAFVPEIPHSIARFEAVRIDPAQVLPGDGYAAVIKPFRTIEDIHVVGAVLGYLVGVGRRHGWPAAVLERVLAMVAGLRALSLEDPLAPAVHIALAGVFRQLGQRLSEMDTLWESVDTDATQRWRRDRPLLDVANRARGLRRAAAWQHFGQSI